MRIDAAFVMVALLATPAAWAQLEADTDGDGAISLAEFQTGFVEAAERQFQALDTDGNGVLSGEEFTDRRGRSIFATDVRSVIGDRALNRLDTDDDGFVTLAEVQAGRPGATSEWFAGLDDNGDGQLSKDELSVRRFGGRDRDDGARIEIDTNDDGAWSLEELQAVQPEFSAERFNRLDSDNDGLIGQDERRGLRGDRRNRRDR